MATGLVLILFGSVWITAVFSRFEKIPSDWEQVDELQGTFALVDEGFLTRLQENQTVKQLLSAPPPGPRELLNNPAVVSLFGSPAMKQLTSSPALLAVLRNQGALRALANPTLVKLLSNSEVLKLLQDPAFVAALRDPGAIQQLRSHPVAGPLLADPAALALLQDPAFQGLLASGALAALGNQPEILALLTNPALGQLLLNPSVQALLADPGALALVLDSRTGRILANSADLPIIEVPVVIHRERRASSTKGDTILINEQKTYIDPATRQALPGFPREDLNFVVDQKTRQYLPGSDENRTGFWGLPFNVDRTRIYPSWVTAAKRPLPAEYGREEKVRGLKTFTYVVEARNLDIGEKDPVTGLPLVVDASITTWNEPRTGSTVRIEDYDAVSALGPSGAKYPRFVADVKSTEESIKELVHDGRDNRSKLVWFGSYMPWMAMGVGIALTLGGAGVLGLPIPRKGPRGAGS